MRTSAISLFASLALVARVLAVASPEPCSDHPGVVHAISNETTVVTTTQTVTTTTITYEDVPKGKGKKKNKIPKVQNATVETVAQGATSAVDQYTSSGYVPKDVGKKLSDAISKAVDKIAPTTTVTTTDSAGATVTVTTVATPTTTSAVDAAANAIKTALDEAFAAVDLSQSGLDNNTIASLESCLETVLASGGLPAGYACLSETGSTGAGMEQTLNTILEQFVGILPNVILDSVFDAVSPSLTSLLPASEASLVQQIEDSIKSVIATSSGSSVTALEQLESCYTEAIKQSGNTSALACYSTSGAAETLQTMENSVIEQFIGVLPASLVSSVQNIVSYNLANTTAAGGDSALAQKVQAQISSAIDSAGSTLAGNTVTLAEQLASCTSILISTGNATAAQECITNGSAAQTASTLVNGLAEQFSGYLPSSFFTDLVEEANTLLSDTKLTSAQIDAALDSYFNNATSYGPAYVTCIEQVQTCVVAAIKASGNATSTCAGPSGSCGKITSSSSSAAPSSTANINIAAIGVANATVASSSSVVLTTKSATSTSEASSSSATPSSSSAAASSSKVVEAAVSESVSSAEATSVASSTASAPATSSTEAATSTSAASASDAKATVHARRRRNQAIARLAKRDKDLMAHVRFGRVVRRAAH